jgi:hypothetical protein
MTISANGDWLDQFEEGNAAGGQAGEVEAVPYSAVSSGLLLSIASRRADTYLPDDFVTPFSDDFAQCAGPISLSARHHRPPGDARTIVGNNSIANPAGGRTP